MEFPPIAIVGRGCVLPGALSPGALWELVSSGGCALTPLPDGRWRVPVDAVVPAYAPHSVAGYVTGFESTAADDALVGADMAARWALGAARQALGEAGAELPSAARSGLVLGWLALPDEWMTYHVEEAWHAGRALDANPRRRNVSPAGVCARALGFGAGSLALDAACASSLYALKLACDRLHDGSADLMLAGGVSAADPLLLQTGFSALSALSRSARYRPLQRDADGLVPAQGAALLALMRPADASVRGIPVLGVIRGIGLSNDGRGEGLLVPSVDGQVRAMRAAYAAAGEGVAAESVTLLECHATGTARGDAVEVESSAQVFAGASDLVVGIVKANVGHAMTAAGAVGVLKVLGAIEHGIRPLVHGFDEPIEALRGTPLRVPRGNEPWCGPRRAAVSAFGFGGNNAHVVIDAAELVPVEPVATRRVPAAEGRSGGRERQVAVVGVGVRAGNVANTGEFVDALLRGDGDAASGIREGIAVELDGLRLPPADLAAALARHVLILETAREAARGIELPPDRTQVLVATDCDAEIVRHTARLRHPGVDGHDPGPSSAQVVGFLANMTANRISSQLGLTGASFAVAAEDAQGTDVVATAVRAISRGEADAALVGAVDVCCPSLGDGQGDDPADAGVVLVLKRLDHARRDGDRVMSVLPHAGSEAGGSTAKALVGVASRVLADYHRAQPRKGEVARPWFGTPDAAADTDTAAGWLAQEPPRWHVFSGRDRAGVLAALGEGRESREGPARLVIVAASERLPQQQLEQARRWLLGQAPKPRWAAYREQPLAGRVAAVYPGGAAAYAGMGAQLGLVFPDLVAELVRRCPQLVDVAGWVHDGRARPGDTISCVWGAASFAHLHTAITRDVLGIEPSAALGYSSGESTALTALGAWQDLDGLVTDLRASPLFTRELAGSYDAVRRVWERGGVAEPGQSWRTYLATLPAEKMTEAAWDEPAVYLMAVNSPYSCTFGGDSAACARVAGRLGAEHVIPLDYDLAIHAPVVAEVAEQWHELHRRPTTPVPGVSFYGCASAAAYELDDASAADANTAQAVGTLDFLGTVEQAWADGVRVFIEHGPAGGCTEWIGQTLGAREHLAVALDDRGGMSDVDNFANAVAALIAAGVPVEDERLRERFEAACGSGRRGAAEKGKRSFVVDAHPVAPLAVPAVTEIGAEASGLVMGPLRAHRDLVAAQHLDFIRLLRDGHAAYLEQSNRIGELILDRGRNRESVLFDRADLEFLAVGPVSRLFGPAFAAQDGFARQTRMPGPPMLLADRVLRIDAEPATMGTGSICTQTDVRADSWYLDPCGRMPAGLMVEAGQADLLLISWLGADLSNRGERVYRLLGCEITYHGSPPHPGETLTFDISIDEHAEHGGVRLFSFQYRCAVDGVPRLSVRRGQAGFFTDAELAGTQGVLWETPPVPRTPTRRFDREQVRAFAQGRPGDCFGSDDVVVDAAALAAHVRTPRPAGPDLLLFDEVEAYQEADQQADGSGRAFGGGYLRASLAISLDSWFFEGHFAADPCMPGTLMLEGAFQLMAFHLTAGGATVHRDGWRFEPVPEHTCRISCRAQVIPESRELGYQLFVRELRSEPYPTLVADVLCSVDGVKAFLAEGLAVRLVPDWPLDQWRWLGGLAGHVEPKPAVFGLESLLACAWGRPSAMMGGVLAPMDDGRAVARLPGPPYHFVSRILELGERSLVAEYDVPAEAWFWDESGGRGAVMPLCVLLEVALQPCGWLALYTGEVAAAEVELLFRNLGGQGTFGNVVRGTRVLRTEVRLHETSRTGSMIIDAFSVRVWADETLVADLRSDFGFFPPAAFVEQPGLAGPAWRDETTERPAERRPQRNQPRPMLSLIDRITGVWPAEGRMRAEKDVAADDWYFRAHFFQDPVQPGSLGLEAMLQLVQCFMLHTGLAAPDAKFEPWLDGPGRSLTWKYRGQVVPRDRLTVMEIEITESGPGFAVADAWLSVGGRTIYHATGVGVRAVSVSGVEDNTDDGTPEHDSDTFEELLDPTVETWVADHRPTWTVPALPMMSVVDRLAAAADASSVESVAGLRDVRLSRWIVLDRPVRLRGRATGAGVELEHDGVVVASAAVADRPGEHAAPMPLADAVEAELPYARGGVFHGPAFHYLTALQLGSNGARGTLDAARGTVPRGRLHQGLLDATLHVIPHDALWRWSDRIKPGYVGYPYRLPWIDFLRALPSSGPVRVEARFAGFDAEVEILPMFDVQVFGGEELLLAYRLVEVLVPLGPLAGLDAPERAVFLRDRTYVPGAGLATSAAGVTRLRVEDLDALEWFPGTVAHLYRLTDSAQAGGGGGDRLAEVAVRDHVGRRAGVHPSAVVPSADLCSATVLGRPGEVHRVTMQRTDREITVRDAADQ